MASCGSTAASCATCICSRSRSLRNRKGRGIMRGSSRPFPEIKPIGRWTQADALWWRRPGRISRRRSEDRRGRTKGTDRMQRLLLAAAIGLAAAACMSHAAFAQATDQPTYVVTYIEVAPKAVSETRGLIATHCTDTRKAPGLLEVDALQR